MKTLVGLCGDSDIRMLHDRVQSDASFTACSHLMHQCDDVRHVTWTGYPAAAAAAAPRYDVITGQYPVYRPPASVCWSDVTSTAQLTDWSRDGSSWWTDDRRLQQLSAGGGTAMHHVPPLHCLSDDIVHGGWQLQDRETGVYSGRHHLTASSSSSSFNHDHRPHHHQLTPCHVTSSSQFIVDDQQHSKHQFGTRPTRASTSIGSYVQPFTFLRHMPCFIFTSPHCYSLLLCSLYQTHLHPISSIFAPPFVVFEIKIIS